MKCQTTVKSFSARFNNIPGTINLSCNIVNLEMEEFEGKQHKRPETGKFSTFHMSASPKIKIKKQLTGPSPLILGTSPQQCFWQ